jgi:hypothetical protein
MILSIGQSCSRDSFNWSQTYYRQIALAFLAFILVFLLFFESQEKLPIFTKQNLGPVYNKTISSETKLMLN